MFCMYNLVSEIRLTESHKYLIMTLVVTKSRGFELFFFNLLFFENTMFLLEK